jgi:HEPN domain-containing protein
LKAYYIYKKEEQHPYTHNLEKLAIASEINLLMTSEQLKLLSDLTPIYIDSRYEDYKNNLKSILTEEYCLKLIEETEALCSWIETLIL